VQVLVQEQRQC